MTVVRPFTELRSAAGNVLFEGARDGVELSVFVTAFPPGGGPRLHLHPYAEVFIVEEGEATFVAGDETLVATGGHVLVVEPEVPHTFRNSGDGTLRVVSVHPRGEVVQTDL
jgi:mannose-6-phosphate isomerase-like protein (cupin superfamily)